MKLPTDERYNLLIVKLKVHKAKKVEKALKAGTPINIENDVSPLMYAAEECHTKMVQFLIAQGAKVNAIDQDGRTA